MFKIHRKSKYLTSYIKEFSFKYNNRDNEDTFNLLLTNALWV